VRWEVDEVFRRAPYRSRRMTAWSARAFAGLAAAGLPYADGAALDVPRAGCG
jgi:hypothetical protein